MNDPKDLSAGKVPAGERNFFTDELEENRHRLWWKNGLLGLTVAIVLAFYWVFLCELRASLSNPDYLNHADGHPGYARYALLAITAAIPTLLLIKILGVIAYPKRPEKDDPPPLSPFLETLREFMNAVVKKIGGH